MKNYAHFTELPLTKIVPSGRLRAYLEKQMRGLTGHLDECGHPTFQLTDWNTIQPASNDVEYWWPQEQSAYWIDGLLRCALLLRDQPSIDKARHFLHLVLENPDHDGYLGPAHLKFPISPIKTPRWPHAVFFRAFAADYMATNDERIPDALQKHYLSNTSPHNRSREVVNVEMMLWVYEKTGRPELLEAATKAYQEFNLGNEGELDVLPFQSIHGHWRMRSGCRRTCCR